MGNIKRNIFLGVIILSAGFFATSIVLAQPGQSGAPSGGNGQASEKTSKAMEGITPGQQPDLISQMDKDKDGKVSKQEWIAWGRPEKLFATYDKNGNGTIDTDEKPSGMPSFELTDVNGDGKVVADEFPGPEAMFKQFDKDGNGYLSESELSAPPGGGNGGGAPGGAPSGGSAPSGPPQQ